MIIDIFYFIFLLIFLIKGYSKGFVVALFAVIAVVIGVWGALKLSGSAALLLFKDVNGAGRWAPLVSYILVFLGIVWLVRIGAMVIHKSLQVIALGFVNRLGGALLYGFLVSFVASSVLWLLHKMNVLAIGTEQDSLVFSIIEPLAPQVFKLIGHLLPFVKNTFDELSVFFDTVKQEIGSHVGNN